MRITQTYEVIAAEGAVLCDTGIFAIAEGVHDSAPGSIIVTSRGDRVGTASPPSPAA